MFSFSPQNSRRSQTSVILDALVKADMPVLDSHHNHSLPPTKVHLLNSLTKLAERELVHLINWAKNVPGKFVMNHNICRYFDLIENQEMKCLLTSMYVCNVRVGTIKKSNLILISFVTYRLNG